MAKLTRRSYKRRKIIMGVTLFGAVGLVSTGFAAWVLSASTETSQDATLSVGQISDTNMEFEDIVITNTANSEDHEPTYQFEPLASDDTGRVKFKDDSEKLSLTVSGKLKFANNLGQLYASLAKEEVHGTDSGAVAPNHTAWDTDFAAAITKGYVVAPESYVADAYLFDVTNTATISSLATYNPGTPDANGIYDSTFTYKVEFKWGSFFAGLNPGVFFDIKEFKTSAAYSANDYVFYGMKVYKCAQATTGAWNAEKWTEVSTLRDGTRFAYSAESTYALGDVVVQGGKTYECVEAISTAEAFTPAHWEECPAMYTDAEVQDILIDLHDNLSGVKLTLTLKADSK